MTLIFLFARDLFTVTLEDILCYIFIFIPYYHVGKLNIFNVCVTVVKRNGQLVKLEFCLSVVRSFVYHSSRL